MEIYILIHYWAHDSGMGYQQEETSFYSSEELLTADYCLAEEKQGKYIAYSVELNTHKDAEKLWEEEFPDYYDDDPGWLQRQEEAAMEDQWLEEAEQHDYDEHCAEESAYYEEWGDADEWLIHNKSNLRAMQKELLACKQDLKMQAMEFHGPLIDSLNYDLLSLEIDHKLKEINDALNSIHEDYSNLNSLCTMGV